MKRYLLTGLIMFVILCMLTVIGDVLTTHAGYSNDGALMSSAILIKGIFVCLFMATTLVKSKVHIAYRLPLLRIISWSVLVLLTMNNSNADGDPAELLYLVNDGLCSLYLPFTLPISKVFNDSYFVNVFLTGIVAFAAFEYLLIKVADAISSKVLALKTVVA